MDLTHVAVVGANGFIGSHLVQKLLQKPGIQLSLFGRQDKTAAGSNTGLLVKKLDVTAKSQVATDFADIDIVYYLASETIPSTSWDSPLAEIEKNLVPFLSFMEQVIKLKVKKVAFISSGGTVYGTAEQAVSEDAPKHPFSPHGITKLTMEHFLNYYQKKYGLQFDVYRASNIYGPGQNTKKGIGIINTFIENILQHGRVNIFGDGSNVRDFLYVDDLAEIMTLSLKNTGTSEVYNVSSGNVLSLNEILEALKHVVQEQFEVIYTAARKSDNSVILLDNNKILNAYPGFRMTTLAEGIRKTYRYIKQEHQQ